MTTETETKPSVLLPRPGATWLVSYESAMDGVPLRLFTDADECRTYVDTIVAHYAEQEAIHGDKSTEPTHHPDVTQALTVYEIELSSFCCFAVTRFEAGVPVARETFSDGMGLWW